MSDLFWLTTVQLKRIEPHIPLSWDNEVSAEALSEEVTGRAAALLVSRKNAGAANQPQLDPQFSPEIARRDAALEDSGAHVLEGRTLIARWVAAIQSPGGKSQGLNAHNYPPQGG